MRFRRVIRHDEDCPGGDDCECEDSEDCDDGEYCDEDEERCVEREDGADSIRRHLGRRYGVDLSKTPARSVVSRAAAILGVSTRGLSDAAAIVAVRLRADGEWSEDDHPRAPDGKFGGGGEGTSNSSAGKASGQAHEATIRASTAAEHDRAAELHRRAETLQRGAGAAGVAQNHARAAEAHETAAQGLRVGFKPSATKRYAGAAVTASGRALSRASR